MCIRDSLEGAPVLRGPPVPQQAVTVAGGALVVEAVPDLVPVSYTHLRAHETVLDLVCRLLLEKKKQLMILKNTIVPYIFDREIYHSHTHISHLSCDDQTNY